ncbi:MAG: hypothetical protein EOO77_02320 [Oxalobacteraceae bacterium]|nr:MAG: hypothetical protein EOO77_02320 [Oxalobacteraceae bacterium]
MTFEDIAEDFSRRVVAIEPLLFLTRDGGMQAEAVAALQQLYTELEGYRASAEVQNSVEPANIFLGFKCIVSSVAEELNVYRLLKMDQSDRAWDALIRSQAGCDAALRAHRSFSYLTPKAQRLRELEKFLFPPLQFVSAGMIVRRQICSICRDEYAACDHLAGKPYCGRFCYVALADVEPNHVALVDVPANRHCRILSVSTPTGQRNVMTSRVSQMEGSEFEHSENQLVAQSVIATQMDFEGENATGTTFPIDIKDVEQISPPEAAADNDRDLLQSDKN